MSTHHPLNRSLVLVALAALATLLLVTERAGAAPERGHYIVVFEDSVERPGDVARAQAEQLGGKLGFVYHHALHGYAAELPKAAVEALERNPRVAYVEPDAHGTIAAQEVPTGVERVFASSNKTLDIDGVDDLRADVDIAILDTGIDLDHPDLNVFESIDCTIAVGWCKSGGNDGEGHGTLVAGTAAAIDNGEGVVGVAPGARLWSVKVLNDNGEGTLSGLLGGMDWITARADKIEVTNASLVYTGLGSSYAFNEALEASIDAGIVNVAAAGNDAEIVSYVPGENPEEITVSALADFDGGPSGGKDQLASWSNFGSVVDVAAPGEEILSTAINGEYDYESGTSMAAPHVAGAAALLAANDNPENREDVEDIAQAIAEEGNLNWIDTSKDGVQEPLLDVSNGGLFRIAIPSATTLPAQFESTTKAKLRGLVNPGGPSGKYRFEYGKTTGYGTSVPSPDGEVAAGTGAVEVSQTISGLETGVYHYRVVLTTPWETLYGEDETIAVNPPKSSLAGTSCTSSTHCMAVGQTALKAGYDGPYAVLWDGSEWTATSPGTKKMQPKAVSCTSSTFCVAVGSRFDSGSEKSLAMHWNGTTWSAPTTPNEGSGVSALSGVSCTSSTNCIAVGRRALEGGGDGPLAMRWNGTEWSLQAPGAEKKPLSSVSCTSSTNCIAVGSRFDSGSEKSLAMHWNGTTWSTATTPNEGAGVNALSGVSCTSSTDCVAVGRRALEGGGDGPLAMEWDGIEWSLLAAGAKKMPLKAVSCTSSTNCIAVGSRLDLGSEKSLAMHWNGTTWSAPTTPNEGSGVNALSGVSCASSSACVAVGRFASTLWEVDLGLAEEWDGEAWSLTAPVERTYG